MNHIVMLPPSKRKCPANPLKIAHPVPRAIQLSSQVRQPEGPATPTAPLSPGAALPPRRHSPARRLPNARHNTALSTEHIVILSAVHYTTSREAHTDMVRWRGTVCISAKINYDNRRSL